MREHGADARSIHPVSRACTVPSWRCRAAPNVLKTAPCRMSVPIATVGLKPNRKTSIGVMREPPPIPVIPTRMPMKRPAIESFGSTAALYPSGFPANASDYSELLSPDGRWYDDPHGDDRSGRRRPAPRGALGGPARRGAADGARRAISPPHLARLLLPEGGERAARHALRRRTEHA